MAKPAIISDREKSVIVKLIKAGVETSVVAKAFGVPRQTAAAFLAWDTMRSN